MFILAVSGSVSAQTKNRRTKKPAKPAATPAKPTTNSNSENTQENVQTPAKRNERPANESQTNQPARKNQNQSVYFYEFTQPNFLISKIFIEHDEQGKGKITFQRRDYGDEITDPIQLSSVTMEKLKNAFAALDFLNSNENYQFEKDYSHLGNVKITVKKDGRERTAQYNWTENKEARILMDEYRKIGNQYVWIFEMNVARQNQPLNAPGLMKTLDGYLKRKEISDPVQLIPFLTELSNDERIPLIARNHAAEIIKQIEKQAAKAKN